MRLQLMLYACWRSELSFCILLIIVIQVNSIGYWNLMALYNMCTTRSVHVLDLVIAKIDDDLSRSAATIDIGFQDHFPVFIETLLQRPSAPKTFRKCKAINRDALKAAINQSQLTVYQPFLPLSNIVAL